MRTLLARTVLRIATFGKMLWSKRPKGRLQTFLVPIFIVCLFSLPHITRAASFVTQADVLSAFGYVLDAIVNFLGSLVNIVVSFLLQIAQYNDFGNAVPVTVGWVIVRDIVNMFFIIIVIISAFSTVTGLLAEFHYKKVLAKLLVAAIVINFSKTLVQLVIDFSQVVMLTFVNAFAESGHMGFAKALGLTKMMNLAKQNPNFSGASAASLVMAYLLAVVLLIIALGTVLILALYLVARIIFLWMALIFSPLAFVASALPGSISKSMGSMVGDYWGKLAGMLTGGPMVAFFLWLTLATVQASVGAGGLSNKVMDGNATDWSSVEGVASSAGSAFVSAIGNNQDIASFIIGIAMMLMGLEAAVSAAGKVSKSVGKIASDIQGKTMGAAKWVGMSPYRAAAGAGNAALGAGKGAVKGVDQRLDVRGKLAAAGLRVANAPGINRVVSSGTRQRLADATNVNKKAIKEQANATLKGMDDLSLTEQATIAGVTGSSKYSSPSDRLARAEMYMKLASDKNSRELKDGLEAKFTKEFIASGDTQTTAESKAKVKAEEEAFRQRGQWLNEARGIYEQKGDKSKVDDIDTEVRKNLRLAHGANEEETKAIMDRATKKLNQDPLSNYKDISKDGASSAVAMAKVASNVFKYDDTAKEYTVDPAALERFVQLHSKNNKELTNSVESLATHIFQNKEGGKKTSREDLSNLVIRKDASGAKRIYNVQTGELERNARQAKAHENLVKSWGKSVKDPARTKGDVTAFTSFAASGTSDQLREYLASGGTLKEYFGDQMANNREDNEAAKHMAKQIVVNDLSYAKVAAASLDTTSMNQSLQTFNSMLNELPDLDQKAQLAFLSELGGKSGGEFFAKNYGSMNPSYRKNILNLVETALERRQEVISSLGGSAPTPGTSEDNIIAFGDALLQYPDLDKLPKPLKEAIQNAGTA